MISSVDRYRTLELLVVAAMLCALTVLPARGAGNAEGVAVLLTLTEAGGRQVHFDRSRLRALPQHTVNTDTPWTDGVIAFSGPLARDVLAAAGMRGSAVVAVAINDYSVRIPIPIDELERCSERHHGRSIWQLREMTIE
jgi:hypothetical protein